jgi:kumamolisin
MSNTPRVPCHPYFKLRRLVPHIQIGPLAPAPWNVSNLCSAYKWPTGLAGGGVIAIVELGGGWVMPDMDAYFKSINQPVPSITDVSVDGTKNTPNQNTGSNSDADVEVALDIQVSAAAYYAATGKPATIRIYWAQDIAPAVEKASQDGCDVCSISWGADENTWGTQNADEMESAASTATDLGMIVFAASGDNDSGDGGNSPANVDCPASCPHIIGCGGTYKTSSTESVWNDSPGQTNGEGTGGGYSTIFPAQTFQIGIPKPPSGSTYGKGRMVPDVAADADPNTGYNVTVHGANTVVGGTSAAAPLYAGLFAAFGKKLGFITPTLYETPSAFTDITSGDNGYYKAAVGPDPCTGLGSPIGDKLAPLFTSASGHNPNDQIKNS